MKYGRWLIAGYDRKRAVEYVKSGLNPLISVILSSRNVTKDEAFGLLDYSKNEIYDPFLMKDMDRAAERIKLALEKGEKITVYGDYDVDGITAGCLMTDYLRSKGAHCTLFIPDRNEDGYGVRDYALKKIKDGGTSLVVTVDCGMTAAKEAEYAREIGLDMVISDHHECGESLPQIPAVNPKREDGNYPNTALAGVGVAFKLACAIEGVEHTESMMQRYCDLVALGTIADVMDVTGENRNLIGRGLEIIKKGSRPGIAALCEASGTDLASVTSTTVGFVLAPKINAAGRIGKTEDAVRLIMETDRDKAKHFAQLLCSYNRRRQTMEGEMFSDAEKIISPDNDGAPVVLASEKWHQGIAGIVASRIAEKYRCPAVVICIKDGVGRGSCRSFGDFELFEAVEDCADILKSYGGHRSAAGITIDEDKIDIFRDRLVKYYRENRRVGEDAAYNIDFEVIKPGLLTLPNVDGLRRLEPFGSGNPTPLLCMMGAKVETVTVMSGGKHTKFKITKFGESYECIKFGKSPEELGICEGCTADVAFQMQVNEYRGRRSVQLLLTDMYVHSEENEGQVCG